jgi:hypothetical protein
VIHPYPTRAEAIKQVADEFNRTRLTPFVKTAMRLWLAVSRSNFMAKLKESGARVRSSVAGMFTRGIFP